MLDASKAHLPNGESGSHGNAVVGWRCYPGHSSLIPMRRALSHRKSGMFSFMFPYSREMMIVDISLDCVGSQRPLWGTLVRFCENFHHVSLFTKDDDSAKAANAPCCF